MEEKDYIKAWEKIIRNSYYPLSSNNNFVLYDDKLASKIPQDANKYLSLVGGNLCGEIILESKFDKRKRIIKKLLSEDLEK